MLDETYIWGRGSVLGTVGHLREIYRITDELHEQTMVMARSALKKAYQKTQSSFSSNPELRALFDPVFVERLRDWNNLVRSYVRTKPDTPEISKWKDETKKMLAERAYDECEINAYLEAIETNRALLERLSFLF